MLRPRQISYRFPRIIVVKRKVTPPEQELRKIPPSPFVLDDTNEKLCLLVPAGARGLRLLTHREIKNTTPDFPGEKKTVE
jgi:hypothetical protein